MSRTAKPHAKFTDKQLAEFRGGKYPGLVKRLADELAATRAAQPVAGTGRVTSDLEATIAQLQSENKTLRQQLERGNTQPVESPGAENAKPAWREFDPREDCPRCRTRSKVRKVGVHRVCLRKECAAWWDSTNPPGQVEPNAIPF